jgi:cytochrome o ubiquinol oxidase subunit 3
MGSYHLETYSKTIYGFWVYIMTDCVLFSILFATYAVLHANAFGGPSGKDIFDLSYILGETMFLLVSSFTCGLGMLSAHYNLKNKTLFWFALTFIFGACFLGMELVEFAGLVREGNSWARSGFLTSYFTLVGTHGFHISVGLLWMLVMFYQIGTRGITTITFKRLSCLSLFWHFLDVIWIFIFTLVYLLGAK